MGSLKSFIKAVRKSKTIADERAVVRKESAAIRTSFKDVNLDQTTRRINISKLLYLYIIGEKTHFGQVECIKLLASPKFADKRLGYLATSLILDENQEVLTLLTNSLDNDMQHPNNYIVGLALCCLGNIASPELARDLYTNVDKLVSVNHAYIKKKSTIVAAKLIEKDPELVEFFIEKLPNLLNEKNSGVILGSLKLMTSIIQHGSDDDRAVLVKLTPKILDHLKRVTSSGYNPDYDVLGINDPFLQVNLISTLRALCMIPQFSDSDLEKVNDMLTQICSNIETGKNVNHAVLYECIKTIFRINSDQALKILGINLLGKFLGTKDNNTRYVSLNTLLSVINIEPNAVQRHRATIVSCLNDGDISIRRRSLELSFAILNESNIRVVIKEIINYLQTSDDNDLKPYIISQLISSIEKFSPNDNWKFDNLVKILKSSENFISVGVISNILNLFIRLSNAELKKSILLKLIKMNFEDLNQYSLSLITVWCIGEFTELILNQTIEVNEKPQVLDEAKLLNLIELLTNSSTFSESELIQLNNFVLNTIIKLSVSFTQNKSIESLRLFLQSKTTDNILEIQIRANEYLELFQQDAKVRSGLLAKMPPAPVKQIEMLSLNDNKPKAPIAQKHHSQVQTTNDLLLDLMDDAPAPASGHSSGPAATSSDLLSDIFSSGPTQPSSSAPPSKNATILDLFDQPSAPSAPSAPAVSSVAPAFTNGNLSIRFVSKQIGNGQALIEAEVQSHTNDQISEFQLLIAVPKSQKLSLSASGKNSLTALNDTLTQTIKLIGKAGAKIKLRVKANYKVNGAANEDLFDFAGFEQTL